jgi:hypothetical protein
MKNIFDFNAFLNESYYSINESGIPLYRGSNFNPERTIKRNRLLQELQDLLNQVMEGSISEVTVLAEIPTQGKNAPQYLKDIYAETGMSGSEEDEDSMYDPETDVYQGNRDINPDEPSTGIFVDSEFIVKEIDMTKGVIIGIPHSLRRREGVFAEIDPETVEEVFIK